MAITLRAATAEDAETIASVMILSRNAFLPFAPLAHSEREICDWTRHRLLKETDVTVAVQDEKIVGVVAVTADSSRTCIEQMYLLPGYVRRGIGTKLLQHVLERHRVRPVKLFTFQQNETARRFYEHHGFKAVAFTDGRDNEEQCADVLYELPR